MINHVGQAYATTRAWLTLATTLLCTLSTPFCLAKDSLGIEAKVDKSPLTVPDSISWRHIIAPEGNRAGRVAIFSPDGSHFVLHSRHGNLAKNVNVDSLLLFNTQEVVSYTRTSKKLDDAPKPLTLVSVEAEKDEDSVSAIQWISNSQVGFTSRSPDKRMQAFSVDIVSLAVTQITDSDNDVFAFATAGGMLAYYSCALRAQEQNADFVIVDSFDKALPARETASSRCYSTSPVEIFAGRGSRTGKKLSLPPMTLFPQLMRIWMSPSGDHAVILAPATDAPAHWSEYMGPLQETLGFGTEWVRKDPKSMDLLSRTRYLLLDLKLGVARPLLDAPTGQMAMNHTPLEVFWRKDGRSVVVSNTYLPLNIDSKAAKILRMRGPAVAEVNVLSGDISVLSWEPTRADMQNRLSSRIVDFLWDPAADRLTVVHQRVADGVNTDETYVRNTAGWRRVAAVAKDRAEVSIKEMQGINERPKIYVDDGGVGQRRIIFDPNPNADGLSFGHTDLLEWRDANGTSWRGGVVLPPNYAVGVQYPLVVQTHGFSPVRFLLDGPSDGQGAGTAFAAQALANAGFVVLQIDDNPKVLTDDLLEGPAVAEGFRSGIARLVADGLVDASRVGLIAFSRTGWHALHFAAQNPDILAALVMSDALVIGYSAVSYQVADPSASEAFSRLTGAAPTPERIGDWFTNNPVYALARSKAAVRLEEMGQGIGMWELYALLRSSSRPVEFVVYPDGSHVLQKPAERLASQGGSVDWLRFWLQNYEDPDSKKQQQYARWRRLRELSAR